MRFSIFTTILTATLAIAAPSPNASPDAPTDASPSGGSILETFQSLQTSLTEHSNRIQAAAGSVTWNSPQADKDAAGAAVVAEISAMTTAIQDATTQVDKPSEGSGTKLRSRDLLQDLIAIGSAITNIVFASINIALTFPNSFQAASALVSAILALVQASIAALKDLGPILQPTMNLVANVAYSMQSS